MASSSHGERGLAGHGLGLQHPQRRVGPARAQRDDGVVDERGGGVGLRFFIAGDVLARDGLLGEGLVEVLEPGRVAWAIDLPIAASIRPRLHEALSIWNIGRHDAEGDVEAGAVVAEPRRDRHAARSATDRARGVAAQPQAVERRGHLQAGGVGGHQPERGAVGRSDDGSARPDVGVGLAGRGDPALRRVEDDLVAVERRGRAAPRSGCASPVSENASVERCSPAAMARAHVVGAVLPRSPPWRSSACTRPSRCCRTLTRGAAPPARPRPGRGPCRRPRSS